MNRRQKIIGLLILGLISVGLLPGAVSAGKDWRENGYGHDRHAPEYTPSIQMPDKQVLFARLATVSIEEAIAAAIGEVDGVVIAATLENEYGGLVWEIKIVRDPQIFEVIVDAGNENILEVEAEDNDHRGRDGGYVNNEDDDDEDEDEDYGEDDDSDEDAKDAE